MNAYGRLRRPANRVELVAEFSVTPITSSGHPLRLNHDLAIAYKRMAGAGQFECDTRVTQGTVGFPVIPDFEPLRRGSRFTVAGHSFDIADGHQVPQLVLVTCPRVGPQLEGVVQKRSVFLARLQAYPDRVHVLTGAPGKTLVRAKCEDAGKEHAGEH